MTANWRKWFGTVSLTISLLLSGTVIGVKEQAMASIVPDDTLGPERSTVHALGPQLERIEGGALRGTNLFHSFRAFNIGEGRGAYFANPAAVENIFSRVTGSNPSHLFGTLGVLGEANLFFLNPNGILFGPNFNLDVRGSFVATTANSIALPDGSLFSASDPQAPPLLTVNVTAPIGLRFEGASPGSIVNAGNLTVDEGQHLTLAAGTVASTGLLAAPGGEVAVVSVPGASADGMPTVQLGEAGQFLDWALEPLPISGSPIASAPTGVALPDLLAGDTTTGLTVNASGEAELASSGLAVEAGDVTVQQLSAGTATLSAAGNLTLVESQLGTTSDLQLLAKDTVRVRDSAANPFIAAAGEELLLQGDQSVDIFALNHPGSGLFSGSDMTLRSADTVNGDAHYWSGGSFQIEQLDGSPGGLSSPTDPVIRSLGDVSFDSYFGASLHILAAGSVEIRGNIFITNADPVNGLIETITLSNGEAFLVDGQNQLTLDIRAGMNPVAVAGPSVIGGTAGIFFEPFPFSISPVVTLSSSATSADIVVGNIFTDSVFGDGGRVLLTNQQQPNPLLTGEIIIGSIETRDFFGGGAVAVDSRSDIDLAGPLNVSAVDLSRFFPVPPATHIGNGGEVTLVADQDIVLLPNSTIFSIGLLGGPIALESRADIAATSSQIFSHGVTPTASLKSGDITISTRQLLLQDGAQISTSTFGTGSGGHLTVDASELVHAIDTSVNGQFPSGLFAETNGSGNAGNLTINTQQLRIQDGAQISTSSSGAGSGGHLTVDASGSVHLIGTSVDGRLSSSLFAVTEGKGNAGNLTIDTRQLLVRDGAVVLSSTFGEGAGGNLSANVAESVQLIGTSPDGQSISSLSSATEGKGAAGNLNVNTRQLLVRDGARISTGTRGDGTGGNLTANAIDWIQLIGTSSDSQFSSGLSSQTTGKGNAGHMAISTRQLLVRDGAQILAGTSGDGAGGSLVTNAAESVQLIGTSPDGRLSSGLFATTEGDGDAGSLNLDTRQLLVQGGASISTNTFGDGAGGNLIANAAESVQLIGTSLNGQRISGLFAQTEGDGDAGSLNLDTRQLLVQGGARISTGTFGDGAGGSLTANATESVQLIGTSPDGRVTSGLFTATEGKGAAGKLTLNTQQLLVQGGARVSASTSSDGSGGSLIANAAESVQLIGTSLNGQRISGLFAQTEGRGDAGSLTISTRHLLIQNGARISAGTLGDGAGGSLSANATESVQLMGTSSDGRFFSSLLTATKGKGAAGSLNVDTRQLLLRDGAQVLASTFGAGAAGSLTVNAADWIRLIGISSDSQIRSGLFTNTRGKGAAGNLTIDTRQLLVQGGAQISAGTSGEGAGGNLSANAADWVQVIGTSPDGQRSSSLFTSTAGKGDAGNLTIGTRQLLIQGGAQVSTSTSSNGGGGNLTAYAAESIQLIGTSSNSKLRSGLFAVTVGKGAAGSLTVDTRQLLVRDGAGVSTSTLAEGTGGSLRANATDWVQLIGTSPDGQSSSGLFTDTGGQGAAGSLTIDTRQLLVRDGAYVSASTAGNSAGGSLRVDAADWVQVIGTSPDGQLNSGLFTITAGKGVAGNLAIGTRQLLVQGGAQISAGTVGDGAGGNLSVTAADWVQVIGTSPDSQSSGLFASTLSNGRGGNLNITTGALMLQDGARTSVSGTTAGDAGNLGVTARSIFLDNGASITAETASGEGGNITLNVSDLLLLRRNSQISTTAGTAQAGGDGGNITIDAGFVVAVPGENSDY